MKLRIYITLIMLLLCLGSTTFAQTSILETKVSLQYKSAEIGEILKDLSKKYKLKFSYSNNVVPEKKKVSISIKNIMLKDALYDIFSDTDVAFQVIGEQIVFKKGIKRSSTMARKQQTHEVSTITLPTLYSPKIEPDVLLVSNQDDFIIDTMPDELELEIPVLLDESYQPTKASLRRKYKGERRLLKAKLYILKDSIRRTGGNTLGYVQMKYNYAAQKLRLEFINLRSRLNLNDTLANKINKEVKVDSLTSKDTISETILNKRETYQYAPYQVSFISPIGTNGKECGNYVNSFSFNAIGGYSAGLMGIEMGGIANIEKDFVRGLQMAGIANIVKNTTDGFQLSGFANVCGDTVKALQAAGFCNVVDGDVKGIQVAGFCNVDKGATNGLQGAGFINVIKDSLIGIQTAGFGNICGGNVTGIQASGFINVAKKVKGMQIGVINICDSIQGLPVGLLSIVKKGGYRRLDIYGTEALYANISYKIGVRSLYNIIPVGIQYKNNKWRFGFGYGVGAEAKIGEKGFANTDLVSMFIWEESMVINSELNLMNRISSTFGIKLGNRTALFAGPALNVMVSSYQDPDKTEPGSDVAPYALYNHIFTGSTKDVNLKIWFGFTAGVRF